MKPDDFVGMLACDPGEAAAEIVGQVFWRGGAMPSTKERALYELLRNVFTARRPCACAKHQETPR